MSLGCCSPQGTSRTDEGGAGHKTGGAGESVVTGVPAGIDVNKPPKNFRDAMSREDRQEWAEAYDSEYQGFLEHGTLKIVRLKPGDKILGTTTRTEYKVITGVFKKRKVLLCVMGNQVSNRKRTCIINWENCMPR